MCGIVGYIGYENATPFLLKGLKRLEYRGYDSAGIAIHDGKKLEIRKAKGRIKVLSDLLDNESQLKGTVGIGHTRWATHGEPSDVNSHPQVSSSGKFAVVHNGIIENYLSLKKMLLSEGKAFVSETDTEVVAQLLEFLYDGDLFSTVKKVLEKIEGSYSLVIISEYKDDEIIAVKKDNPLIIGLGENENFIASDAAAIVSYTKKILRINDNEIAVVKRDGVRVYNKDKEEIKKDTITIDWDVSAAEKCGYEHFMLKEILEQPHAIHSTITPRIKNDRIVLDEIKLSDDEIKSIKKICIIACGSAYHVGCAAKYFLEETLKKPVEVDLASEFRYRNPLVDESVLLIAISQSGETADTLAALREGKKRGAKVLSIVNVVGSSVANESDSVIYTWAGPEIAVATTKAYSTQLTVMYLIAIYFAEKLKTISDSQYKEYVSQLKSLSEKVKKTLDCMESFKKLAEKFFNSDNVFFIGRNVDYAVALEGSLKLKEISYIHSEAYAAGELKHGTISLIEKGTVVVAISTVPQLTEKMISNIREVKARGATVVVITTEDSNQIKSVSDFSICIPKVNNMLLPSLTVIPLQFLSYYIAYMKGCDIDKPRNLAKSVTVE